MSKYEKDLEEKIEILQKKLEVTERERDTFQELLDNVIKETYKRFNRETETYTAGVMVSMQTEALSKKYVCDAFGIDIDEEYDRIFKEKTEKKEFK